MQHMIWRVVGRVGSGLSKDRSAFIFRVKLVPEDKDTTLAFSSILL
jgi:hypothetical protein